MKLLAYTLFAVVVTVATARVILRGWPCYGAGGYLGWTHDDIDAAHTAALAQWRAEEAR